MTFHELLNQYMTQVNCTGKQLSIRTGTSETTLSRYRHGERTPEIESENLRLISSAIFIEKELTYTYEEYLQHLSSTRAFSERYQNVQIEESMSTTFRNIQLLICPDSWVLVSKDKASCTHFMIEHSTLVDSIARFVVPVRERGV